MAYPVYTPQPAQPDYAAMGIPTTGGPGPLDALAQLLTGGANLATARTDMNDAQRASQMADPWAANRPQYQDQLNQYMTANSVNPAASTARTSGAWDQIQALLANPNSITSMPGYRYGLDQSLEAVNRGAGASGMLNSGNRLAALQDRGEGYARGWYKESMDDLFRNLSGGISADQLGLGAQQQGFNQLDRLAGVTAGSPTAAAEALLRGRQNQNQSIGAGIGGLATGAAGLFSSPAGQAIIRALTGAGGGAFDLTQGAQNPAVDDWLAQNVYGQGGGGGGYLPDPSDVLGGSDFSDLFGGASGFDIFG